MQAVTPDPATSQPETTSLTLSVSPADAGERLDVFLAAHIEGWSRARLHRLIEAADVLVNGSVSKPSHKLRPNDHIEIDLTPTPSTSFAPEDIPVEVVYEDDDLIVVNKPAGLGRGGRPSFSIYKVRRCFERFTLLDVELKTGRTHQIRVHLAWLKHPVVGDEVYGAGRDKTVISPVIRSRIAKLGRQFLHAEQLGFRHPRTDQKMRFTSPLPKELQTLLDEIEP